MKKSITELTLYDIAACEHEVWMSENSQFGFNIEVEDENGDVFEELGIHPMAAEGLADFCKRYLRTYERLNRD